MRTPRLAVATLEQNLQCIKNEYVLRGNGKTLEKWIGRERELENTQSDIRLALILEPTTGIVANDVVGGCCWTPRTLYYVNGIDKTLFRVNDGVCLTSVFVPESHRGQGYGKALKDQVFDMADRRGFAFQHLYSEVGDFYADLWKMHHVFRACLEPRRLGQMPEGMLPITNCFDIAHADCAALRTELLDATRPTFAIVPHIERYRFWAVRQRRGAQHVGKPIDVLWGAILPAIGQCNCPPFITWHLDWLNNKLLVLRLRHNGDTDNARCLIQVAQDYCSEMGLDSVEVRDPDRCLADLEGTRSYEKDTKSEAGFTWHAGWTKYLPEEEKDRKDGAYWHANEIYCWA